MVDILNSGKDVGDNFIAAVFYKVNTNNINTPHTIELDKLYSTGASGVFVAYRVSCDLTVVLNIFWLAESESETRFCRQVLR